MSTQFIYTITSRRNRCVRFFNSRVIIYKKGVIKILYCNLHVFMFIYVLFCDYLFIAYTYLLF